MPRVSIISNVYNGARFLREALESAQAQTFIDWEMVLFDDCSTDDSAAIAKAYARADPRIRYILADEQVPLGRARHLAIGHASGEWLAFLDQDDVWTTDKLERQLQRADDDPEAALVYGRSAAFTPDGRERDFDHRHEFCDLPEGDIFRSLFEDSCYFSMSSALLKRSAIEEIGGIPEAIHVSPDYFMFVEVARRYRARAVQGVICRYRVHDGNMTNTTMHTIHGEVLWVIGNNAERLDPGLVRRRRRVHHTLVAVSDMRHGAFVRGLTALLRDGAPLYLATRPPARLLRALRRRLRRSRFTIPIGETERVALLGTSVTASSFSNACDMLAGMIRSGESGYISCANAFSVTMAQDDPGYRELLNGARMVTTDGMSVVWALRALGHWSERVHNDDLFLACCERYRTWRHFLVGGRSGQPEQVADAARSRFPGIRIVGARPTPERPVPEADTERIVAAIREARPDVVWVGMGTPAQDEWMALVQKQVGVPMVGVGSLFDLLAGRTKAAPQWMKAAGLQWLFRLAQEPRRLAFRYLYYNARFLVAVARQLVRGR